MNYFNRVIGVVLGAGQGKRIQEFTDTPKVLLPLNGKFLIQYGLDILASFEIPIIIVVKYKKNEVIKNLGPNYNYIEQKTDPGTGGAVKAALHGFLKNKAKFGKNIDTILILQGDDTAFLNQQTIHDLLFQHLRTNSMISVLTTRRENSTGFGRVIRSSDGKILRIVEEKNASLEEKFIKEVNTGVWVFNINWLRKYSEFLKRNELTGEYYVTDLLEIAVNHGIVPFSASCQESEFFGINTEEEYKKAILLKEKYA